MKNCNALENQTTRRILLIACATALAVVFTVALPQSAHAAHVTPPPVPPTLGATRGTRRSSWVTPSAPRTTSACPRALASPLYSSRRRPRCSATTTSKSSPTTSAPTSVLSRRRSWHDSRHVAGLPGHEHRLGQGATNLNGAATRRPGCDCLAPARCGWSPRRTDRWPHADGRPPSSSG